MFEIFKVGIRISLINQVSAGLGLISSHLLRTHKDAEKLEAKLVRIRQLWTAGLVTSGVGIGMLYTLKVPVEEAAKYAHQLSQLNTLGMTQQEIAIATGAAWKTSHEVMTSSAADNLKTFRELRSAFRGGIDSTREIAAVLPVVQRVQAVLDSVTGTHQEGVGFDMIKAIELRSKGALDAATVTQQALLMGRTLTAFGGTLNAHDFHMAIKQAKEAGSTFSDDFVYNYLPTLMQEVKTGSGGAQQAGTILRTMSRAIIGGHILKSSIPYWIEAGLVGKGDVVKNATGNWQIKPGSIKGSSDYEANPFLWTLNTLQAAEQRLMDKHHWSQQQANSALFNDRQAAFGFFNMIVRQGAYTANKDKVTSADSVYKAYQKLAQSDPELADQMVSAQWKNLMAQIGLQILPKLLPLMNKFANGLNELSDWIDRHPRLFDGLLYGFITLGAVLTVGGVLTMGAGLISILGATGLAVAAVGAEMVVFTGGLWVLYQALKPIGEWLSRFNQTNQQEQDYEAKLAIERSTGQTWFDPVTQKSYPIVFHGRSHALDEVATLKYYRQQVPYSTQPNIATVAPAQNTTVNTTTTVNLDGKQVAKTVVQHVVRSAQRAPSTGGNFDGTALPAVPAM